MLKTLPIEKLLPGMFVADLHRRWMSHSFLRNSFLVKDQVAIDRLIADGIDTVTIDTARGLDLPPPPEWSLAPWEGQPLRNFQRTQPQVISLEEDRRRGALLLRKLVTEVRDLTVDAVIGRKVEAEKLAPYIDRMIDSIQRHPDGLLPLARLKSADGYLQEHAAASAALIIALGVQQKLPKDTIYAQAMGALLQDIGQAKLGDQIISRPTSLSVDEQQLVRRHVQESLTLLDSLARVPDAAKHQILEHHERFDGSGYPYNRAGLQISMGGRMAAIVDTYDAMTSDRPFRLATSPGLVLQDIYSQGGTKMDQSLVHDFVKAVGVYPVGTLVRTESGHLGVVQALNLAEPTEPLVKIVYKATHRHYVTPVLADLSLRVGNHYGKVVSIEDFHFWGLNPKGWEPA